MMDNVQVERWTFQPWHGGFWWCTSTDMTITVWWFELIILGGRLTRLTLLFSKCFGLPRLEKDAQARDGTENVWTCTNSQTDLRPVSRSQNKLSMCGGFWQGLGNVKVFTAHMDLSYRRPLPANSVYLVDVCVDKIERQKSLGWSSLPGKSVAWLRESGLSKIDQLYWSASLVSCTSLPLSCFFCDS